ncbi:dolichol-phosphate mannosyltransferase subunit 3-like isoform X2 [Ruditapes philippinarum]|uniref:dolichol-phosphate mannosyltransferase subunit 3-like isoform X2 n=1 Tax=Ruditapes philippinarum TaxID=129788 RepID=UPI00295AD7D4|nr:dolichol-phosphate mannosyltransferase subunit 3-like isoform X2 [Ruditapes philippinarum]
MLPKLFQWLFVGGTFVALWIGLLLGYIDSDINDSTKDIILFLPVFVIVAFAMYSVVVIAYRVATFNDCLQDSIDLKQDIEDAKKDLKSKGFKFD